jgi:hypothetical protein
MDVTVTLKKVGNACYAIFGPKGNVIAEFNNLQRHEALETAANYVTSFRAWKLIIDC